MRYKATRRPILISIQEAFHILKPNGIAGFTIWGRCQDSALMTIVPKVLDELGLVPIDANKRTTFHLGQDDEALRNKFLSCGVRKCTLVHYPGAIECFDADGYVECIMDGAASTKSQVESCSESDQQQVRTRVFEKAKAILDQGKPLMLDVCVILVQK